MGVGIVAMVTSFAMLISAGPYGGWPQYFPWSLPMLVLSKQAAEVPTAVWVCGIGGILVGVAGCADFCRREVS